VGDSPAAQAHGFHPTSRRVNVRSLIDDRQPQLQIVWENSVDIAVFEMPLGARVFTRERWTGAPLVAGLAGSGNGAGKPVLWTAVAPGARGFERFPYLPQALVDLGLKPALESRSLWSSSTPRTPASRPELPGARGGAAAWRAAGGRLHFWERDRARDEWLERLIKACHRHGILVYAWVEFPHVSEAFWNEHPEWREKTASGQDAQLDWRQLMNLTDPQCERAVATAWRGWPGASIGTG